MSQKPFAILTAKTIKERLHSVKKNSNSSMSPADLYFQKRSLVSNYLLFYLKKRPLYAFELLFLCSDRKWRPPRKIRQKKFSFKSTAEVISLLSNSKQFFENLLSGSPFFQYFLPDSAENNEEKGMPGNQKKDKEIF